MILGGTSNIDVTTQKDNQDQIENHTLQSMLLCKHKYNKDNKYNLKELERKVIKKHENYITFWIGIIYKCNGADTDINQIKLEQSRNLLKVYQSQLVY